MEKPDNAKKIELKAGKGYKFCTCGHSGTLPYCDNNHREVNEKRGTAYKSVKLFPESDITISVYSKNWDEPAPA